MTTNFVTSLLFFHDIVEKLTNDCYSFVSGNGHHFLSQSQQSYSGRKTQILILFLTCIMLQKVPQSRVKWGLFSGTEREKH